MFLHSKNSTMLQPQRNKFGAYQNPLDLEDELNNLFNKKFQFRFSQEWKLPELGAWFTSAPWKVKELVTLKSRLNFHKSQLNDFNIEEWSCHTRRRNPSGEVCWKVRCLVNPEFLTQAWAKFYECAYTYNIVPRQAAEEQKMVSLHLCEAPGAFITSLNHFLRCHHPDIVWDWIASTLNPYYEGNSPSNMISDDRFMFHTLEHWDFGLDNTGNLMDWNNSQAIIKRAKSLGKVLLVTADGSIDCLLKPDAQEEVTSPLHYCEIVTALQTLSQGGTLIFKLFTIFEHSTISLLYLINHLFTEVNIYKPVTSRQGNSEVYAICLNFKGCEGLEPYLQVLKSAYGSETYSNNSLFPLEAIPEDFLKQVQECADYFCTIQCQVINSNLQAYLMQRGMISHSDVKKVRAMVASEFIRLYDLRPLEIEQEVLKGILHEENKLNTNPRYHRGSFTERQHYTVMTVQEKAKHLMSFLKTDVMLNPMVFIHEPVRWLQFYDENIELKLEFTHGKPLAKVNSSKFIFVPIFKFYLQIFTEKDFKVVLSMESTITNHSDSNHFNITNNALKTINYPEISNTEDYHVYEKRCFLMLHSIIKQLPIGESLLLQNYNALTHFNVSILYILCTKCFESTGFTKHGDIVLYNLLNKSPLDLLESIEGECSSVQSSTVDVLSPLSVKTTNGDGNFFINMIFYNNTFYRNKCEKYLRAIEQEFE